MWELIPSVPGPPKLRPAMSMNVLVETLGLVSDALFIPACVRGRQFLTRRGGGFVHLFPPLCQWQYACLPRAPIHPAGSQLQHIPFAQQLCSTSGPLSLWTLPSNLPACLGNLGWLRPIIEMDDCCPPGLIAHVIYSFLLSRALICTE